jgi:molybdate/tungstate transport system ATP-binding protein
MIRIENLETRLSGFNLHEINLSIEEGEFFILMGPTGAGKTVLLEALAGLVPIKNGRIVIGEKDVTRLPPEKRGIGIVYQDYALFPHLTVIENIKYGLRFHKVAEKEAKQRLSEIIEELDLAHLENRLPLHLSGGELQRVALARALMVKPDVLLLDEPLSALDPNFREEIRHNLKRLHQSFHATLLMVTHDFAEALSLADKSAVINRGRIEQIGTMENIFQRPGSQFVADFVGMKNIFEVKFHGFRACIGEKLQVELGQLPSENHRYIAIRPEDISVDKIGSLTNGVNAFRGTVKALVDQGFYYEVHVQIAKLIFKLLMTKKYIIELKIREGTDVFLSIKPDAIHTF